MNATNELERIAERIKALSNEYLNGGTPYLLSRLGKDLGDDLRTLKIESGQSLARFIQDRLSGEYTIVLAGQHSNIQAIVRSNNINGVESVDIVSKTLSEHKEERYNFRFWAAFTVPLRTGTRYLNMSDFIFRDVDEEPRGDFVVIGSEFITPEGIQNRDAATRANVERWIADNGFSKDQFLDKPRSPLERNAHSTLGRSVLEAIIDSLDKKQLSNTSLTLDVIAELHRRRF